MKYIAILFSSILCCVVAGSCEAQEPTKLFSEIARVDAELFKAFNTCDLKKMGEIFAEDLEFYHDTAGLAGYKQTMENSKSLCDKNLGLKREIVGGSLKVYPINNYGAIQQGRHTFCHIENGKNDCGTFEFVHIWKSTNGNWKLTRVISYGH